MEDIIYDSFVDDWASRQADIIADLEYDRNLADHLVTTEMVYSKFNGLLNLGLIPDEQMQKWQALGFTILNLQYKIYNKIPDFPSKQRGQLLALSREIIKEQRFHNDTILTRGPILSEAEMLEKIKSNKMLVKDAFITQDKVLKIVIKNFVPGILEHVATAFARDIDAHGGALKTLILYNDTDVTVVKEVIGEELFVKPL
jgi:hypothetical protein